MSTYNINICNVKGIYIIFLFLYIHMQLIFINLRFHICKVVHLLKFIHSPKINTDMGKVGKILRCLMVSGNILAFCCSSQTVNNGVFCVCGLFSSLALPLQDSFCDINIYTEA